MRPLFKTKPQSSIPRIVWTLGFVSLFMDLSSELVHSILPVYLVNTLGASVLTVGFIEGVGVATAQLVKVFSGALSDFWGHRKRLILLGYGLAALTKPLFPLAVTVEMVFAARFIDRIGKGIRGAPRDAMIADVAPAAIRGACFGLRQAMDTVGAFLGPLLAIGLLYLYDNNLKIVLWFAVLPAALTVVLIVAGVHEPRAAEGEHRFRPPMRLASLRHFPWPYWRIVLIGAVFTLARFSEAFLVLRAQQVGMTVTTIPLVMVAMSLFYALSAYPAGVLSDAINKNHVLSIGLLFLIAADCLLAGATTPLAVLVGAGMWGLHMGFTEGILAALVAATTPPEWKGSAFGLFNFVSGVFSLLASVIAGWLWDFYGASATFYTGAGFAVLVMILTAFARK